MDAIIADLLALNLRGHPDAAKVAAIKKICKNHNYPKLNEYSIAKLLYNLYPVEYFVKHSLDVSNNYNSERLLKFKGSAKLYQEFLEWCKVHQVEDKGIPNKETFMAEYSLYD